MYENLPEFYLTEDRQQVAAPTYEAAMQCYMVMQSAETGQVGPTLVEPGEVFTTEETPNHQWIPLNRGAARRIDEWLASLPVTGANIPQEIITEAAYQMRPREGEPVLTTEQWWPAVLKLAAQMADRKRLNIPQRAQRMATRPGFTPQSPMPFTGSMAQPEPGRPPVQPSATQQLNLQPQAQRQRGKAPAAPLANAQPTPSPQSAAG
jgi:hypothetical protein